MSTRFDDWEGEHLQHYGVLGMKWGQRRFQNKDGSLTAAGEKRYAKTGEYGYHYHSHATKKYQRKAQKAAKKAFFTIGSDARSLHEKGLTNIKNGDKRIAKQDKLIKKALKYQKRAERSAELDRREQEAAEKISTGKAIVTRLLLGGAASKSYQQYRAMAGGGEHGAATKGISRALAYIGGTPGSRLAKAAYIRKGEKNRGVVNAINKAGGKAVQKARKADDTLHGLGYIAKAGLADGISDLTGRPNRKYPLPRVATPEEERRAARKSRKR